MTTINHIDLSSHYTRIHFSGCQYARFFASTFVKTVLDQISRDSPPTRGQTVKGSKDETHPPINRTVLNSFHNGGVEGDV